jgi:hypothetical protein
MENSKQKVKFMMSMEELAAGDPAGQPQLGELVSQATRDMEAVKMVPWESVLSKLKKFQDIAIRISGVCDMGHLGVNTLILLLRYIHMQNWHSVFLLVHLRYALSFIWWSQDLFILKT